MFAAVHAAEPPAPMSGTINGIFVGQGNPDGNPPTPFLQPFWDHENWFLDRPVGSILVYGDKGSWKRWLGNLGWTIGGPRFGNANRPLIFSIPLFPDPIDFADSWAAAVSTLSEIRVEAEAASTVRTGSAVIIDVTQKDDGEGPNDEDVDVPIGREASAVDGAPQDDANSVKIKNQWGSLQFNNLPLPQTLPEVRISIRAVAAGTMDVMVNGVFKKTVSFPATPHKTSATTFVFKELRITGLSLANGDSIKFYSNALSPFQIDYITFGNYDEWHRRGAKAIKDFRPNDPVLIVRPGWEFNLGTTSFPWSATGGNENNYIEAFRRFVTAFRAESSRFRFSWCANHGGNPADAANCYPGNDYVDTVGMDVYDSEKWNPQFDDDPVGRWDHYLNQSRGLDWLRRWAVEHNKLLSIDEWGATGDNLPAKDANGNPIANDNPLFISNMQQWLAENRAIFHHYWDNASGYNGLLRDNNPTASANQYLFSFATPVELTPGVFAPPANGSDDFDKSIPRAQWKIENPDHANWSLTAAPGRMRLISTASSFAGGAVAPTKNIVIQTAPDKDFEIVTRLYGKPGATNQLAGLLVYADDNNYVRMARKFENGANVFSFGKEVNGTFTSGSATDTLGSLAYLKITRVGSSYSSHYSADGVTWTPVWSTQTVTLANARVGFAAYGAAGFTADFDTFFVNKLEAEYGRLTGVDVTANTAISGQKFGGGWASNGDSIEWKNVPGGSQLVVRYAATAAGTKRLYIDGVLVQSIAFSSTGSTSTYQNLTVNRAIPAGSTLKLQHDSGDTAWNLDYVTFVHAARFEAEEAVIEGVTYRDSTVGSSNDGAVRIDSATWGAVKFVNLNAGGNITLRYRSVAGGDIRVDVNGNYSQTVTLPPSSAFRDIEIDLTINVPTNGSVKLYKNNTVSFVTDYIVVRP